MKVLIFFSKALHFYIVLNTKNKNNECSNKDTKLINKFRIPILEFNGTDKIFTNEKRIPVLIKAIFLFKLLLFF